MAQAKDAPYKMPAPYCMVRWYSQLGAPPAPAIVTGVGNRSIQVAIFWPDNRYHELRDGVRHVSDPEIGTFLIADEQGGFWDYTEDQMKLHRIFDEDLSSPLVRPQGS
jgi:hypothetical protein